MLRHVSLILLAVPAMMGLTTFGQGKPDFTGSWELAVIERDGNKIQAGRTFKETQIWVHQEPKLSIKIMTWAQDLGYRTLELSFTTDGKKRTVGYRSDADGRRDPVEGSARWDGNRLVVEQELTNVTVGVPRRIIRTCTLDVNGPRIVAEQVYWMPGSAQRREEKWYWAKKSGMP